ncbi:MAG TPA: carboxymuconolactone decarboxylase family protein [Chloroflexota bacterium]|nr:carboxymuconolactone decarboxylase family protein [Chloroflexota bacterium]
MNDLHSAPTMIHSWPEMYERLQELIPYLGREAAGPMSGFAVLHKKALASGALPGHIKELIALGISVSSRCDGCIAYHVHDALGAGATRAEILEAIGVAVMMGGGPAVIYGAKALEALDQFQLSAA